MMDYFNDIKIDRYSIEEELERQPKLYLQWSMECVEAEDRCDRAKDHLEIVRAELFTKVKKHPEIYGLVEKPTDTAVKAIVEAHKKTRSVKRRYFRLMLEKKRLQKAEKAFSQRKKMLEKLVDLNIQMWYAEPKVKISTSRAVDGIKRRRQRKALSRSMRGLKNDREHI